MAYLNINSLFCSNFDEATNSILNRFDKINLNNMDLSKFNLVILTNKSDNTLFHIECYLCKEDESGKLEKIIDWFSFNIPKEGVNTIKEDGEIENSDTFIREISIEKLKENGEGRYSLIIFSKEIEASEYGTLKVCKLEEMNFVSRSILTVTID